MINKNILFLITSIFLGFIISIYYAKNNFKFFIYFILISIILYLIFYNLSDVKEKFSNISNSIITNSEIINIDGCVDNCVDKDLIRDYLEDYIEEENIFNLYKNNSFQHNIFQNDLFLNNINLLEETEIEGETEIEEENNSILSESINLQNQNNSNPSLNYIQEEEININKNSVKYENPDLNKILLSNPLPLNINISYNAQNSVNEMNNESDKNNENENNNFNRNNRNNRNNFNRNLGGNYGDSRINLNSDWIYGENAWTNYPDYYIPEKNKLIGLNNLKNREIKTPCPLMINTPWSEYLSGDSNP